MALFTGSGVALVTPMHEDKSVNYEMQKKLIEWQIANGTDAIIVCGTTGEPSAMTRREKEQVIVSAIETVHHQIPVIAGTGSNCTQEAVALSRRAQELGADGLLVVTPYYNKATQRGLYEHYGAIAKAVSLPVIMYNVPSRTGCNLLPETAVQLGNTYSNIVAIKEASGSIAQVMQLAALLQKTPCLDIYSGNDDQVLPILALGGKGVISVLANIAPAAVHEMTASYLSGDVLCSRELQLQYMPLIHALFTEVNPIPVKKALELMGYPVGSGRLPLTELSEEHRMTLFHAMRSVMPQAVAEEATE